MVMVPVSLFLLMSPPLWVPQSVQRAVSRVREKQPSEEVARSIAEDAAVAPVKPVLQQTQVQLALEQPLEEKLCAAQRM